MHLERATASRSGKQAGRLPFVSQRLLHISFQTSTSESWLSMKAAQQVSVSWSVHLGALLSRRCRCCFVYAGAFALQGASSSLLTQRRRVLGWLRPVLRSTQAQLPQVPAKLFKLPHLISSSGSLRLPLRRAWMPTSSSMFLPYLRCLYFPAARSAAATDGVCNDIAVSLSATDAEQPLSNVGSSPSRGDGAVSHPSTAHGAASIYFCRQEIHRMLLAVTNSASRQT